MLYFSYLQHIFYLQEEEENEKIMYNIYLKNNKTFHCDKDTTIFSAAKSAGLILEHSCLTARCKSCVVKVLKGATKNIQKELVLSEDEKKENYRN